MEYVYHLTDVEKIIIFKDILRQLESEFCLARAFENQCPGICSMFDKAIAAWFPNKAFPMFDAQCYCPELNLVRPGNSRMPSQYWWPRNVDGRQERIISVRKIIEYLNNRLHEQETDVR